MVRTYSSIPSNRNLKTVHHNTMNSCVEAQTQSFQLEPTYLHQISQTTYYLCRNRWFSLSNLLVDV